MLGPTHKNTDTFPLALLGVKFVVKKREPTMPRLSEGRRKPLMQMQQ